ncbi:MAG: hypothetical protein AAGF11_45710 [Myxococcota bacterium]
MTIVLFCFDELLGTVDRSHKVKYPDLFDSENKGWPLPFPPWRCFYPSSKPDPVGIFLDVVELLPVVGTAVSVVRGVYQEDLIKIGLSFVPLASVRHLAKAKNVLKATPRFKLVGHRVVVAQKRSFLSLEQYRLALTTLKVNPKYKKALEDVWAARTRLQMTKAGLRAKKGADIIEVSKDLYRTIKDGDVGVEQISMNAFCQLNGLVSKTVGVNEFSFEKWKDKQDWFLLFDGVSAAVERPELWLRKDWAKEKFGDIAKKKRRDWDEWVEDSLNLIAHAVEKVISGQDDGVDPKIRAAINDYLIGKYNHDTYIWREPRRSFLKQMNDVMNPLDGGLYLRRQGNLF